MSSVPIKEHWGERPHIWELSRPRCNVGFPSHRPLAHWIPDVGNCCHLLGKAGVASLRPLQLSTCVPRLGGEKTRAEGGSEMLLTGEGWAETEQPEARKGNGVG